MEKIKDLIVNKALSKKNVLLFTTLSIIFATSMIIMVFSSGINNGSGFLWVAHDRDGDIETLPDKEDFKKVVEGYDVLPCNWYWITITDFPNVIEVGDEIKIRVENEDWADARKVTVHEQGGVTFCKIFPWHCPEEDFSTRYKVQYGKFSMDVDFYVPSIIYVVRGALGKTAFFHIVPEFAFGTIMAIASTLSGLVAYRKYREK